MARAMLELALSPAISYSGLVNFVGDGAITVRGLSDAITVRALNNYCDEHC
jgi:hypothetical protein